MNILGISALYHDSAAALVRDGKVLAAAQEERFTRIKGDPDFPKNAIEYCLDAGEISLDQIDFVAFYDKPLLTFDRLLETYLAFAPKGLKSLVKAMPIWIKEKLFLASDIHKRLTSLDRGEIPKDKLLFGYHHHSHAASAFYPSPFDEAAVLVMDGVGEWATSTLGHGNGQSLQLLKEIKFPHSLGLLYSAFTYYLGFKVNEGEYKIMGLAPYGEPKYADMILENLIDLKADGSFHLDMQYFDYCIGLTMTNDRFDRLFGAPPRKPGAALDQRDMDLARSVQVVTEKIVLRLCETLHKETGSKNLCMAGGVALNCVANGRIVRDGPFENVWIQPAAGDAGGALGVALAVDAIHTEREHATKPPGDTMDGALLGPEYSQSDIHQALNAAGAVYHDLDDRDLFDTVATALADEKIVGWHQGRMEFGPRALGNRSILGDPRSSNMQRMLNMKIKYRESFRPFAPAILRDKVSEYFELDEDSPYMLLVAGVQEDRRIADQVNGEDLKGIAKLNAIRSDIPAITHVDYSARVQTVDGEANPRFHKLIDAFYAKTGCPVLVNTSFNIRDEPIVCTPQDSFNCFLGTEMDVLVIGNSVLHKAEQW